MAEELLGWVSKRVDNDKDLSTAVGLLILAALDGGAALDRQLDETEPRSTEPLCEGVSCDSSFAP